jgi:transposase-like protein
MSKSYSEADRQAAIDRLRENDGNVRLTAKQTGIPQRTLFRWREEAGIAPPAEEPKATASNPSINDEEVLQRLHGLEDTVITLSEQLGKVVSEELEEAPFNQQVTALIQLIDRAMKMAAELPPRNPENPDDEDPARTLFPPELLEILDTRPDHTPSESASDSAE